MPPYIVVPNPQSYPPTTVPAAQAGIPFYSWGSNNDYASAPMNNVEVAEVLPADATSGRQCALSKFSGIPNQARAVSWEYHFPSPPDTGGATLQGSVRDLDDEYVDVDAGTDVGGEVRQVGADKIAGFNFLRITTSAADGGTDTTIIAKITL